jgi:hypothetical protein
MRPTNKPHIFFVTLSKINSQSLAPRGRPQKFGSSRPTGVARILLERAVAKAANRRTASLPLVDPLIRGINAARIAPIDEPHGRWCGRRADDLGSNARISMADRDVENEPDRSGQTAHRNQNAAELHVDLLRLD